VAAFLHECAQRRWRDPPDELVFAECDELAAAQVAEPPRRSRCRYEYR